MSLDHRVLPHPAGLQRGDEERPVGVRPGGDARPPAQRVLRLIAVFIISIGAIGVTQKSEWFEKRCRHCGDPIGEIKAARFIPVFSICTSPRKKVWQVKKEGMSPGSKSASRWSERMNGEWRTTSRRSSPALSRPCAWRRPPCPWPRRHWHGYRSGCSCRRIRPPPSSPPRRGKPT